MNQRVENWFGWLRVLVVFTKKSVTIRSVLDVSTHELGSTSIPKRKFK